MMNMILWEAIKRNRNDKRYTNVFTDDKVEGIVEMVNLAYKKLRVDTLVACNKEYKIIKQLNDE